ncbi:MAG: protein translocase subunit SecD [Acidimicrobiales bacterium]
MKRGLWVSVLLTLIVCFGALAAVVGSNWKPLLGLDLRGGLSVVYCAAAKSSNTKCAPNNQVKPTTLTQVVGILQNRVNGLGVAQPNIGVQGSNVVAELPGVKDPAYVEHILGETAQLYFRPVLCYAPPYAQPAAKHHHKAPSAGAKGSATASTAAASSKASAAPAKSKAGGSSATTTTTTVPAGTGPLPACPSSYQPTFTNQGSITAFPPLAAYKTTQSQLDLKDEMVLLDQAGPGGSQTRYELGPAIASGDIIKSAYAQDTNSGWQVVFNLTGPGTTVFNSKIAGPYYHRQVAIDLGGVVESAPMIDATSFPGSGSISGSNIGQSSANSIALVLSYGALPVRLLKLDVQRVSPTLGSASLRAGLLAGLLGLLLVMLYTIFYYRALGVVVVLGLVSTAALLYAIICALGHSSASLTLDLSGITGLIVSVGITVDSYVVYFERLKDEVRAGHSVRSSVDKGFKSAYRTILSADAVSFIGALVLWLLSVGDVRGFAFMLGLSTLIDVATAYFFTRPLVIMLGRNRIFTEARGFGIARGLAARPVEEAG